MIKAPAPSDESLRLQYLREFDILDTPEEEDFNEIVRLASKICNTPISAVTLIDASRQWFKAKVGLDVSETGRDISFCGHTIMNGAIFVVPDATKDERFHDNPLVTGDPDIRFYAGVPLVSGNGGRLGTLCVIDRVPRQLDADQQEVLIVLGRQVSKLMELHKRNLELKRISLLERVQRKELERVSTLQKKMISIMAHDIRGPLHSLKSLLQLIPDKKGLSQSGLFLEMAGNQLNATLSLLDNLVDWGQLQMSTGRPAYARHALHKITKDILEEVSSQAALKGVTLRNLVETGDLLETDENTIRFILRNLVNNSIKFTKAGSINVTATASGQTVEIAVEDTGIGMPPAILEQLFCGMKKVSRKGTKNEVGSGLGLSLVKEFVEKMDGTIQAQSTEGKGTRISVKLPSHYPH
ncbi:MAG: GAF domain-containing sensor histidine kinase [Puia sp.]|nr:GAF domain-containing sensor histidine kinase [Puia sp.]